MRYRLLARMAEEPAMGKPRRRTLAEDSFNVPNLLTMGRIAIIPFFVWLLDSPTPVRGFWACIVFTAAAAAIPQAFRAIKRTGTLILVGLSTSQYELPLVDTVLRGITVRGSYLGTRQDLDDVFHLARHGKVRPSVEVHPLMEAPALLDRLRRGEISGRAVIAF